ncbi:MAG: NUDIX domain-containing protein [Candidatus Heimdallarchaeota archaeon]|nr:NUDIX domain-containing protein [Candidatus Heimdallarchaeota archaeon]
MAKLEKIEWETIEERRIFQNKFIGIRNDLTKRPDGEIVEYAVVELKNFVSVICLTEEGKLVLVRQYRYPWQLSSWETAAGLIEPGETTEEAAKREVLEETGYQIKELVPMLKYRVAAVSPAWGELFFAKVEKKTTQSLDPNEFIQVAEFSIEEVDQMIKNGEIIHGATLLALMKSKNLQLI